MPLKKEVTKKMKKLEKWIDADSKISETLKNNLKKQLFKKVYENQSNYEKYKEVEQNSSLDSSMKTPSISDPILAKKLKQFKKD